MHATTCYPAKARLGEGPVWMPDEQRLYWLDIEGRLLHRFDPIRKTDESFPLPNLVGCFVPCENGNLLLAAQTGILEVRIENGNIEILQTLTHPEADMPENRYNDGKCSPDGRFWFGSLNKHRHPGRASLYRFDGWETRKMISGATNSNGLDWSPDGTTFYWIDTPTRRVEAFDYDSAVLSNRRTVVAFPEDPDYGRPDGMTVDAKGMIWIAHWLGSRVTRWNPATGQLLETVRLPVSRVTSLTFGGKNLDTLYITTADKDATDESEAGNLFEFKPGTTGLPAFKFNDSPIP